MSKKITSRKDLQYLQSLPLEEKIILSQSRIREFYKFHRGNIFVSFSGGKDSTVALDLTRTIYPTVPAIFVNTGLEYPEIKKFVKTINNVTWLRPEKAFHKVIKENGYPIISKAQSKFISEVKNPSENNKRTVELRLTGLNRHSVKCPSMMIAKKWLYLLEEDIKISDKCCMFLKKKPIAKYQKETNAAPIIGTMACESRLRTISYLRTGCNVLNTKYQYSKSQPISFWTDADIWQYINTNNLTYSEIYDKGECRTGCMYCMFGVHLEKGQENRFQRMKKTHPKHYKYCIDILGLGKVLSKINVPY